MPRNKSGEVVRLLKTKKGTTRGKSTWGIFDAFFKDAPKGKKYKVKKRKKK